MSYNYLESEGLVITEKILAASVVLSKNVMNMLNMKMVQIILTHLNVKTP